MDLSIFDIFKIIIGPSSSHTAGPMFIGVDFVNRLKNKNALNYVKHVSVDLYGSLAFTKTGHGTDIALILGLSGYEPKTISPKKINEIINEIKTSKKLKLGGENEISFNDDTDIITNLGKELPYHPNGLIIKAFDANNHIIYEDEYYSVGGGFIQRKEDFENLAKGIKPKEKHNFKYKFKNWCELYKICKHENKHVWEIMLENELTEMSGDEFCEKIKSIYHVAMNGIRYGTELTGIIPGDLILERRSKKLQNQMKENNKDPLSIIDDAILGGIAMSEESASYGKVLTAPTAGACGVIPAVLHFYKQNYEATMASIEKFFLVAGAVGIICKRNASISGAEGGCQAEIGSATAMAAAGLVSALGGTTEQCENAAIIGLSHNLGLICDPVGGFVQVPCIERNAINAVKALTSARIAMLEERSAYLTFDQVVSAMREVGNDMLMKYRETAQGGLAKYAPPAKCSGGMCRACSLCD